MELLYFVHPDQFGRNAFLQQRIVVSPSFAFGYQLQVELRSHYVPTVRPEHVDAFATSVRVMAELLSIQRVERSQLASYRLCRAALLDIVDVSMLVDEAVSHGCRLLADTRPKMDQGRWVERFMEKAGIVLDAFEQAFFKLPSGQALPDTVTDALTRAGIRDLPGVLRRCTQAHRRVVFLSRVPSLQDRGASPWRALDAVLGPHLTESAIGDIGINSGRASHTPPHTPAHIYFILCANF